MCFVVLCCVVVVLLCCVMLIECTVSEVFLLHYDYCFDIIDNVIFCVPARFWSFASFMGIDNYDLVRGCFWSCNYGCFDLCLSCCSRVVSCRVVSLLYILVLERGITVPYCFATGLLMSFVFVFVHRFSSFSLHGVDS